MKRLLNLIALTAILMNLLPARAMAAELLIPVGEVIGLELRDDTVTVAAFDDALGRWAREAGLQVGDEILKIDAATIDCADDVRSALARCDGDVDLIILRGNRQHRLRMEPVKTKDGLRLGVYLRQGIGGIGTVTYYDPDTGVFGALGHGVSTAKGGLLAMREGSAYAGRILSVRRGTSGEPGQLRGSALGDSPLGQLRKNTPQGVFGFTRRGWTGQPLPVASFEEVTTGPAVIRSTVAENRVREYSVEILKIYPRDRSDHRNFLLRVTDPDLLEATGGIVQGMSGSPIIQNGRLIGAVTHVLVNDPTTGYGIFIENMLDAAA